LDLSETQQNSKIISVLNPLSWKFQPRRQPPKMPAIQWHWRED
jgi:hypothetical protein